MRRDVITILGPTASGKTRLAVAVARRLGGEIISADSRMVYRGMTIGTGKDLAEYGDVPYHVIDVRQAGEDYNVYEFQRDCLRAIDGIRQRGRLPIICGGTGLYVEGALRGYHTGKCPTSLNIGVRVDRQARRDSITARLRARLCEGMIDEVRELMQTVPPERLIRYGLEYKYVTLHCMGQLTYDEMFAQLQTAIHQFAKRQMTWFHGMEERRGIPIHWVDAAWPTHHKLDAILTLWNAGE